MGKIDHESAERTQRPGRPEENQGCIEWDLVLWN